MTKVRDPITGQLGLLFQVHYPQIAEGVKPRHRFMSSFEQHVEQADRAWQYLLVSPSPSSSSPPTDILLLLDCSRAVSDHFVQDPVARDRQHGGDELGALGPRHQDAVVPVLVCWSVGMGGGAVTE